MTEATKPCVFVADPAKKKLCGKPVPRHEWPRPPWPVMCREHLDTYSPPLLSERVK